MMNNEAFIVFLRSRQALRLNLYREEKQNNISVSFLQRVKI